MKLILFDDQTSLNFLPLIYTRALSKLRFGILTIEEKWQKTLLIESDTLGIYDYLNSPIDKNETEYLYINSRYLPNKEFINQIKLLEKNSKIIHNQKIVAFKSAVFLKDLNEIYSIDSSNSIEIESPLYINKRWDLLDKLDTEIQRDLTLSSVKAQDKLKATNQVLGNALYVEKGAQINCSIINTKTGPVYIGKNAQVQEGSMIRGPFVLGDYGVVKMGTKVYGPTSIGKHSKIGGELNNCILQDYSNKGHDGFLGNSLIGSWCNLGADTNTSNLKNNYSTVSSWSYKEEQIMPTEKVFLGLTMGDHSKSGINTMFNTATVVGCFSNVFGSDFPEKFVPSFMWGSKSNWQEFKFEKALEMAQNMMQRRDVQLNKKDKDIYNHVFELTKKHRHSRL